jgi:hypothetical protein
LQSLVEITVVLVDLINLLNLAFYPSTSTCDFTSGFAVWFLGSLERLGIVPCGRSLLSLVGLEVPVEVGSGKRSGNTLLALGFATHIVVVEGIEWLRG